MDIIVRVFLFTQRANYFRKFRSDFTGQVGTIERGFKHTTLSCLVTEYIPIFERSLPFIKFYISFSYNFYELVENLKHGNIQTYRTLLQYLIFSPFQIAKSGVSSQNACYVSKLVKMENFFRSRSVSTLYCPQKICHTQKKKKKKSFVSKTKSKGRERERVPRMKKERKGRRFIERSSTRG